MKPHSDDNISYFLPHHGVIKESSTTTKLRAVFNASAATISGLSLNDIQMVGPTVQDDLVSLAVCTNNNNVKACIQRDFYVDDFLSGGNSIAKVVEMGKKVISFLTSENFNLSKWKSNSQKVLTEITGYSEPSNNLNLSENRNVSSKTLGLRCICETDELAFTIVSTPTNRSQSVIFCKWLARYLTH